MTIGVGWILSRFARTSRGQKGLWHFLSVRAQGKSRVELEKVRNEGTMGAIDHLPGGALLRETGPDGWTREIWMMPDAHRLPPLLVQMEHPGATGDSAESFELPQPPKQLEENDKSGS